MATADVNRRWRTAHAELASSLGAPHVIALNAGHAIVREAPALVALAVDAVLRADGLGVVARMNADDVVGAGGRLGVA